MIFERLVFASVFLFVCGSARAQINIPSIINVLTDPSGTCASPGTPLQYNTQLNHLSACQGASPGPYSWALVAGTVTSVATTSPLTGGTIIGAGTLGCATCATSAAALTQYGVVIGSGLQAEATIAADSTTTHALFATATAPAFRAMVAGDIPANVRVRAIGVTFDGGGSALVAPLTKYLTVPFACTLAAWNILVDTGTATVATWKIATGTAIPTVSNTISTSGVSISTGTAVHSTTMSDFTSTTVTANDIFGFNLSASASATFVNFILECDE